MRPRFVLALLLVTALVLGIAFLLRQPSEKAAAPPPITETKTPAPVVSVAPPPSASLPAAPVAAPVVTEKQRQAAIDAETDRLQEWSMNDDPESLANILADLTNPEKEIRDAAIEAVKQFGSADAIPTLKQLAANTTDPEEQGALLQAAEFLSLPSISDKSIQIPKTPEQIQAAQQQQQQDQQQKDNPK